MKSSIISSELKNRTILITGGAGSIGSALVKELLKHPIKTARILDVNEHALFRLKRSIYDSRIRLLLGSILDKERIELAGKNVDIVIHVAAVKNIEITEFNPFETIDTNINGTVNMIKMAIHNKIKKFVNISTDKAVEPSTLYGTTKQIGEKLVSWAGLHIDNTRFATVRLGNVSDTNGNVFEIWKEEEKREQPLSITDLNMKRYFLSSNEAVQFIVKCLPLVNKGEIFIPKMKLYNMKELASKISKKHRIIGIRQGEKIEEVLLSIEEKDLAKEKSDMWIIRHDIHTKLG